MLLLFLIALLPFMGLGVYLALEEARSNRERYSPEPGWVYFISPFGGAVEEPPVPIKVGMTTRNPYDRLPELETGSAKPLEVLWTIACSDPAAIEKMVHKALQPFRVRGEWYDRNATLAWIDHHNALLS